MFPWIFFPWWSLPFLWVGPQKSGLWLLFIHMVLQVTDGDHGQMQRVGVSACVCGLVLCFFAPDPLPPAMENSLILLYLFYFEMIVSFLFIVLIETPWNKIYGEIAKITQKIPNFQDFCHASLSYFIFTTLHELLVF